jgi:protein TonB
MFARYTASFGSAVVVTSALLFVMQLMVSTGASARTESRLFRVQEFVRVARALVEPIPRTLPDPIPDPQPPPDRPRVPGGHEGGPGIPIGEPTPPPIDPIGPRGFGQVDGDLLPIVKVVPNYPAAAIRRELEGFVIVRFTVTRSGAVADVEVEESSHQIFEKAAIDAAYRFRYRPRVVDGEAIEVPGNRNRLTFELDR